MDKIYIIMNRWEDEQIDLVVSYLGKLPLKQMHEVYKRNFDVGQRNRELKQLGLKFLDYDIVNFYELERAAEKGG